MFSDAKSMAMTNIKYTSDTQMHFGKRCFHMTKSVDFYLSFGNVSHFSSITIENVPAGTEYHRISVPLSGHFY